MSRNKESCNVLVVDDDDAIRALLHDILEDEGYQVYSARNGRDALHTLRDQLEKPHVILLDLNMPVMTGWEFRAEQQRDPALTAIPVIVISADRSILYKAPTLDAAAYFSKPLDLDDLLTKVGQYCQ